MNKLAIILFCAVSAAVQSVEFGKNIKVAYDSSISSEKAKIKRALKVISDKTCLTFTEDNSVTQAPFIRFKRSPHGGCYTHIGAQSRGNNIFLSKYCTDMPGVIQKDVMNSLGFINEHTRDDRDNYITINWQNMNDAGRYNFRKNSKGKMNMKTKYDTGSVLHYGGYAFSKNRKPTIVAKDGSTLGNTKGLSPTDVEKIRANFC